MSRHINRNSVRLLWATTCGLALCAFVGCAHQASCVNSCDSCVSGHPDGCADASCDACRPGNNCDGGRSGCGCKCGRQCKCKNGKHCGDPNCGCGGAKGCNRWTSWLHTRSNAIPETLPLGSTVRSHYQVMQTNGEAADFILHDLDFVGHTTNLTPDGKDHLLEIAARMPQAPFPVVVERSPDNMRPELDLLRRNVVAQMLTDLGNCDAEQRTVVAPRYGVGFTGTEATRNYGRYLNSGGGFGGNGGGFGSNGFGAGGGNFIGGGAGGGF